MMSSRLLQPVRRSLPCLLLLAAAVWPSSATTQDVTPATPSEFQAMSARFNGEWGLAGSRAEGQRTIDAAVNQAAEAMNFFIRGIARPMLRDNTPLNQTIRLQFRSDGRIRVTFVDTGASYTTTPGRTERVRTLDGDAMRVTQRFNGAQLEQVFQTDQGTRWNVYTSTGAGLLRLDATTNGEMMPQPMHFALDYRRR